MCCKLSANETHERVSYMTLRFLGTGTSTGVPQIGCDCRVCRSSDARDKRLRTSALLSVGQDNLLIDCGPDFRSQILAAGSPPLKALLVTHHHYDHLGGVDDLRPYCIGRQAFPIYSNGSTLQRIRTLMPYCFGPHPYPGSPNLALHKVQPFEPFVIDHMPLPVMPLAITHAPGLEILGFSIGPLAYITDCKLMHPQTLSAIKGVHTLIINALRHDKHPSHLNLSDALDVIKSVAPQKAYLIHMSHQIGLHAEVGSALPPGVSLAYDGLTIRIPL